MFTLLGEQIESAIPLIRVLGETKTTYLVGSSLTKDRCFNYLPNLVFLLPMKLHKFGSAQNVD